jgi:hypothetical protein
VLDFFFSVFAVLGIEPRALHMQGKHSSTELHSLLPPPFYTRVLLCRLDFSQTHDPPAHGSTGIIDVNHHTWKRMYLENLPLPILLLLPMAKCRLPREPAYLGCCDARLT